MSSYVQEPKMHRTSDLPHVLLVIVLGTTVLLGQVPEKPATSGEPARTEDFATAMKRLRDTWVQEFNAGHADKARLAESAQAVRICRRAVVSQAFMPKLLLVSLTWKP